MEQLFHNFLMFYLCLFCTIMWNSYGYMTYYDMPVLSKKSIFLLS